MVGTDEFTYRADVPRGAETTFPRHSLVAAAAVLVVATAGAVATVPDDYPVTAVLLLPLAAAAVLPWRPTAAIAGLSVVAGAFLAADAFDGAALAFRLLFLVSGAVMIVLLAARREARERTIAGTDALRRVEAELRVSEQRYRSLIDATTALVAVTAPDGRMVEPQPAWSAYTGQSWEQHRDYGWLDAFHPDDLGRITTRWERDAPRNELFEDRVRLWHAPSGGYRFVVARGAAVGGPEGAREWIGTVTDVHEHTVAELRAAGSAELRAAVLGSLHDGLLVTDEGGVVYEVNEAFTKLTGFGRAEALAARPPYPWWPDPDVHPEAWAELAVTNQRLRETDDPVETELWLRHRDGHLVPTITSAASVRAGDGTLVIVSSIKDITERKAAEDALRSERDFRDAIVASLQDGLFVLDRQGTILEVNEAWTRITGFAASEVVGMRPPYPWWPDDEETRARRTKILAEATSGARAPDVEMTIRRADGTERTVVITRQPVHDPATREFVAVVGTFRDITRRAQAEARLRTFAALSARVASVNEVAGVASATLDELLPALGTDVGAIAMVDAPASSYGIVAAPGFAPDATQRWGNVALDHPGPISHVAATGEAVEVTNRAELAARFPAIATGSAARGLEAFAAWPLVRADAVVGVLFVGFRGPRTLLERERDLLRGTAPLIAQALERARLFELQRSVASTLQRSLLSSPAALSRHLALATRYEPGVAELEVGGDWFDVLTLSGDRVAVAVGDIVGRGLSAAAAMGQLRSALGALAHTTPSASEAVERLDEFARRVPGAHATTVCYGIVDTAARTFRFTAAGHPPPLVIDPAGAARFLEEARAWPIAVAPARARPEATVELPEGCTLLLYTDGLVERRDRSIADGMAALAAAASARSQLPVEELCDELLETLVPGGPADDIALVALRFVTLTASSFTWRFDASPAELATARHHLRDWMAGQSLPDRVRDDVVLAAGEACTNAIEHAYSTTSHQQVVLEVQRGDSDIVVSVRDYGSWRPLAPDPRRNRGFHLMAAVMDDVAVSPTVHGGTRIRMRRRVDPTDRYSAASM